MKVSYKWLQEYINDKLPEASKIADPLTFHSFQTEGIEDVNGETVLDFDILPHRAHDCLCHYGIAKEIALVFNLSLKVKNAIPAYPVSKELEVEIEDAKACRRYIGAVVKGVKVGPSPEWLKKSLEAVGQRSINNIVDATNYVMFSIGQPMHAFDTDKLTRDSQNPKMVKISVRKIKEDEKTTALDGKEYNLKSGTLVIVDANAKSETEGTLAIAGVKGGAAAAISENTKNILLESANFDPVLIRKTARGLALQTDASKRFENEITPEVALEGMNDLINLIKEVAGGELEGIVDNYPKPVKKYKVGISLRELNSILGTDLKEGEVEDIIKRFGWNYEKITPSESVNNKAKELVGKPYKWGASVLNDAPDTFDCSSLTAYLYKEAGVRIPRVAVDQYVFSQKISKEELVFGDLIFSKTDRQIRKPDESSIEFMPGTAVPGGVSHVGVYVGDGKIIHAADPEGVIEEDIATSSRFQEIVGYGRMIVPNESRWCVEIPHERIDVRIKEDLAEEVGRIYGYDLIKGSLPEISKDKVINKNFYYEQLVRKILCEMGFSEIYTYSFTGGGEVAVANPLASDKGFLRTNLSDAMKKSLELNLRNIDLLGLKQVKVFELGRIFKKDEDGGEHTSLCVGVASPKGNNKSVDEIKKIGDSVLEKLGASTGMSFEVSDSGDVLEINFDKLVEALPDIDLLSSEKIYSYVSSSDLAKYKQISAYPFMVRDIAVFVPGDQSKEKESEVLETIKKDSTDLAVRIGLFDVFTKTFKDTGEIKTSYAFRLVFQSDSRTLTDEEINAIMQKITISLQSKSGWQVR